MPEARPQAFVVTQEETTNNDTVYIGQGLVLVEQSTSLPTPASGFAVVYAKADGHLYFKNHAGTETKLT